MNDLTPEVRRIARTLLENKQVDLIFGWSKAPETGQSVPAFINRPEDAERLIFDEYCIHNLSIYLLDYRDRQERIGIFAKGCDSRGIVRLAEDEQFPRERLYIIGIACPGMKDPVARTLAESGLAPTGASAGTMAGKCRQCVHPNPVISDELLGELQQPHLSGERFADVKVIESMSAEERSKFFSGIFSKCIRCYACRNVCVACSCRQCIFDETRPQWVERSTSAADNMMYHAIRAMHAAGRCIECGECERVCPVGLPLMLLNRKLIKDVDQCFGPYEAGLSLEEGAKPPLSRYKVDDPDPFAGER
jgi:ferredoxin